MRINRSEAHFVYIEGKESERLAMDAWIKRAKELMPSIDCVVEEEGEKHELSFLITAHKGISKKDIIETFNLTKKGNI